MPLNQCKRFSHWKGVPWASSMPVLCSRTSKEDGGLVSSWAHRPRTIRRCASDARS